MKTFKEIFDDKYLISLNADIQIIDEYCLKFDINPKSFFDYFNSQRGDFTGDSFFVDILEYFLFYIHLQFDKLLKPFNVDSFGWFEGCTDEGCTEISLSEIGENELHFLLALPYDNRKELFKNDIFKFFIEKAQIKLFTDNEIRRMKLEKLKENGSIKN